MPSSPTSRTPCSLLANRRWQLSRILSNTGAASATEPLITFSTSAVAVCCCSASRVSLNRRTFSIAITAWSAKVSASATSLSVNSPASARRTAKQPMACPSRSSGTNSPDR